MRQRNIKNKQEILDNCKNVIKNLNQKISWKEEFNNDNPIYLEIGTGKCNFIIENAKKYPEINFIGIEKDASVLAVGTTKIDEYIPNLRLINYEADKINDLFDHEIKRIYLNFSDPWPKKRHAKRRLTSTIFLKKYDDIFVDEKEIIQKTDNMLLFESSIISLSEYNYQIVDISLDLHNLKNNDNIMTEYESKFSSKGCKIYMLKAIKK